MCLSHPGLDAPPLVRDAGDAKTFSATLDVMARRPSWTLRGVFKQPAASARPGLPRRRFHTKINLNEYWGVLEKVVKVDVSWPRPHGVAEDAAEESSMDVDNEVNENLANERFEAEQRMDIVVAGQQTREPPPQVDVTLEPLASPPAPLKDAVDAVKMRTAPPPPPEEVVAEVLRMSFPPLPQKDVIAEVLRESLASPSPSNNSSAARRERARRRPAARAATPASPRPCAPPSSCPGAAGAAPPPSPCRRVPLGTINGMESRAQLRKSLSPLSAFADNLARRLSRKP